MSELLRLQNWLGLNDAIRYAKHIGIDASVLDFFRAYSECNFPMRIDFKNPAVFVFEPGGYGTSYPRRAYVGEEIKYERWEFENGFIYRINMAVDVAEKYDQAGYGLDEPVWISALVSEIDISEPPGSKEDCFKTLAIYLKGSDWGEFGSRVYFDMIQWGNLIGGSNENLLLLSRSHIEKLVQRVLGTLVSEEPPVVSLEAAFCNNSHESYPPELHAAKLLWEGLYINGERNAHHPHQQAAKIWLDKNQDKLPTSGLANAGSGAMINRLITITTPSAKKAKK